MSAPDSAGEIRRWNRHKIDIRLKVTGKVESGATESIFGRGNSMSQGGLGAYIPASINVGTAVDLELTFPYSSNEVKLKAIVRSNEGFRYNLEFIDLSPDLKQIIMESCKSAEAGS